MPDEENIRRINNNMHRRKLSTQERLNWEWGDPELDKHLNMTSIPKMGSHTNWGNVNWKYFLTYIEVLDSKKDCIWSCIHRWNYQSTQEQLSEGTIELD